MREAEIARRQEKYKTKKALSKEIIIGIYVVVAALLLFTIITKNKLLLFLFVTVFSSIVNYQTNITTVRFNPDPEVFSSLLITRVIGFQYALFFIAIPTLFIDIYTARIDVDTFVSLVLAVIINYIMSLFPATNFVILGVILVTAKFVVGLLINLVMDLSPKEIIFEHVLGFVANLIVIPAFGPLFLRLFA